MATSDSNKPAKRLLEAMAAGDPLPASGSKLDPDSTRFHPAEDFALAWLNYWRAIGNHVLTDKNGCAFMCATMAGLNDKVPQAELPPHLRLWNDDMRAGAERAMEVLLYAVPGGRDALRKMVTGADQ